VSSNIQLTIQDDLNKNLNFKWIVHKIPSVAPFLRMFWEQIILPVYLRKDRVQILFCPANIGLVFWFSPFILMVRNMAVFDSDFIKGESIYQRFRLNFLRVLTLLSIKRAKKVIFISKNAQDEICEKYNIDRAKTALIYHGKNNIFNLPFKESDIDQIRKKYNLDDYILYVSNIYRYKNFHELIQAFLKIKNEIDSDIQLLFAGISFDDGYYEMLNRLIIENGAENRIRFIGHVPNDRLPVLYANSRLFVYPSTIENCPNILIEAMGCGAAIVASNIEPMPEICQDGALYCDPNDPGDIADKMLKVLRSNELRESLSKKALERSKFFSWEKTVQETLKVFEEVIG
ncbi:MAG: glycosyltransferase family 4 protein, partial [Candidatus Anammoxibacter sp.]